MTKQLKIHIAATAIFFGGCVTEQKRPEYQPTSVVERIGNSDSTPGWANGERVMWTEGQDVLFVHSLQQSGDARPDACTKAASLEAKTQMLRYIMENVTSSGQLSEADAKSDPAYESLTAFLSQGKVSGASVRNQYWERVEISDPSGERVLKLRCASMVAVKKGELERQLREATNKASGNPKIHDALIDAQKNFIDSINKQD